MSQHLKFFPYETAPELALWLLGTADDVCEPEPHGAPVEGSVLRGVLGFMDLAHTALVLGDVHRAIELLRSAVRLHEMPAPQAVLKARHRPGHFARAALGLLVPDLVAPASDLPDGSMVIATERNTAAFLTRIRRGGPAA